MSLADRSVVMGFADALQSFSIPATNSAPNQLITGSNVIGLATAQSVNMMAPPTSSSPLSLTPLQSPQSHVGGEVNAAFSLFGAPNSTAVASAGTSASPASADKQNVDNAATGIRTEGEVCNELSQKIRDVLNLIFSRDNISNLLSYMDMDQCISFDVLLQSVDIQQFTDNSDIVVDILKDIKNVTIDEERRRVQPKLQACILLFNLPTDKKEQAVCRLFSGGPQPIKYQFGTNNSCCVRFFDGDDANVAYKHLTEEIRVFNGLPIMDQISESERNLVVIRTLAPLKQKHPFKQLILRSKSDTGTQNKTDNNSTGLNPVNPIKHFLLRSKSVTVNLNSTDNTSISQDGSNKRKFVDDGDSAADLKPVKKKLRPSHDEHGLRINYCVPMCTCSPKRLLVHIPESDLEFIKDKVISLDCEFCEKKIDDKFSEYYLASVAAVNGSGDVVLRMFCTKPVEVTDDDWAKCPHKGLPSQQTSTDQIRDHVQQLIKNKLVVGHSIDSDLSALGVHVNSCMKRDTLGFLSYLSGGATNRALGEYQSLRLKAIMLRYGYEIQGAVHCPIEDSTASLFLYLMYRCEMEDWYQPIYWKGFNLVKSAPSSSWCFLKDLGKIAWGGIKRRFT